MVYLTDDFKGGEKCFPFADNKTFSQKDLPDEYLKKCNLAQSCDSCNVVIKPKKGKAVLWYNHLLNRHTGWMDALDVFSGHGDCRSQDGEKWVANIWIDILGDGKHELRSWKSGTNFIKPGNKDAEIYTVLGNPDLKPKSDYSQFKERYSMEKNIVLQADEKIGHMFKPVLFTPVTAKGMFKPVTSSNTEDIQPQMIQRSRILQSVILLLEELDQKELDIVASTLRSRMKPSTAQTQV